MNDIVVLVSKADGGVDGLGQPVVTDVERKVYCMVESVGRTEWFDAGRNGLNAQYVVKMHQDEYQGEEEVIYRDVHYSVYRTYINHKSTDIELYLEKKAGVL